MFPLDKTAAQTDNISNRYIKMIYVLKGIKNGKRQKDRCGDIRAFIT